MKGSPKNLDEAILLLMDDILEDEDIKEIKLIEEENFVIFNHHQIGREIRNDWGLWKKDIPIVKWFNEKGIYHADDMSSIILKSFHRKICNKNINLNKQIKFYRDYWEKEDPKVNKGFYKNEG